jgi:hypothetical protein
MQESVWALENVAVTRRTEAMFVAKSGVRYGWLGR